MLLSFSCANRLVLETEFCEGKGKWGRVNEDTETMIENTSTLLGHIRRTSLSLKEIINQKGRSCQGIDNLSLTSTNTWKDVMKNLIPLNYGHTITINTTYSPVMDDAVTAKDSAKHTLNHEE